MHFNASKFKIFFNHGEHIPSKVIRNSFILAHFKALRFIIYSNHGESIDSEIITKSIYSIRIRNSVMLKHFSFRAFKFKIFFNNGERTCSGTIRYTFILKQFRAFKFRISPSLEEFGKAGRGCERFGKFVRVLDSLGEYGNVLSEFGRIWVNFGEFQRTSESLRKI